MTILQKGDAMTQPGGILRGARRPVVLLALVAALSCGACAPATQQQPADPTPQEQTGQEGQDNQPGSAQEADLGVLRVADLLADPSAAYGALEEAGLTWRDNGRTEFEGEHWPDAMADTEDSHPIYDALAALGAEQPDVGSDYFVGPGYVCLGTGLAPSLGVDVTQRTVLGQDAASAADAVALAAPITTPLTDEQVTELVSAAGFEGEAQAFSFDDSGKTDVITQARAGLMRAGEKDCVWYVQQYGYVGEGGFCALRLGVVPVEVARSVVDTSVLVEAGQLGTWDAAASDDERLELFATAVAQDALVGGGAAWTNVLTGETFQWDAASGSWVAA